MKSNITPQPRLLEAMDRYCTDPMLPSALKQTREEFFAMTGRTTITGVPYVVFCLLIAQGMQDMLDGYSGATSRNQSLLHEAVGIALASHPVTITSDPGRLDRYKDLVHGVNKLQLSSPVFAKAVEGLFDNQIKG